MDRKPDYSPAKILEAQELLRRLPAMTLIGSDSHFRWRLASSPELPVVSLSGLVTELAHEPADQTVTVSAGTSIRALQTALALNGQCLPLVEASGTVGGAISMNFPHPLMAMAGSWRDWVLEMILLTPEGELVRCGSKAVKNVAGYDVQKLLIGARGTLGIIVEVTLRTMPIAAIPKPNLVHQGGTDGEPCLIHRVQITDFGSALSLYRSAIGDPCSGTIWAFDQPHPPRRFDHDWFLSRGETGSIGSDIDPATQAFMIRAKAILDPQRKLNPGEMGIL
jgi:glycolate oxidase FAD binding subunit